MRSSLETVLEVLVAEGFQRLPIPILVGGVPFAFDAALRGTGKSHDLVVVSESSSDTKRLIRLLSGLNRTLDQLESRRPVSLVLIGRSVDTETVTELEGHARILHIGDEDPSEDDVRRAVAVLLPLALSSTTQQRGDPLTEVERILGRLLSEEHGLLIAAARRGPDAVQDALVKYIDEAVVSREEATNGE